jgi:DeoR/GlpR family transcriptional regulator of sugar metabolism
LPDENYYILTNALVIAETILRKEKPTVALLGGDLRKNNFITVGNTCTEYIDKINIQTAVMTATGFIKDVGGFTCGNQAEAEVKRAVIKKADNVIMLLDSSKVNKKTPYTFASLEDVNCMVVDKNFSKDLKVLSNKRARKFINSRYTLAISGGKVIKYIDRGIKCLKDYARIFALQNLTTLLHAVSLKFGLPIPGFTPLRGIDLRIFYIK